MMTDATQITEAARVKGFDPATLEKVLRLKKILQEFYRHPFLRDRLALKGGTAINLFLADLPRLSVDIDLNYVGQTDRELMLKERPILERAIRQVVGGLRYRIQEGTNEHALFALYLNYRNHLGRDDRIEVETNFLMRMCVLPPANRTAVLVTAEGECRFPVLAIEELMAGKFKALIDRAHPRDLYDTYHFLQSGIRHDPLMLKKITTLFASTMDHDLRTYSLDRRGRALSDKSVRDLLYPMLRSDDRPRAAAMLSIVEPLVQEIVDGVDSATFLDAMAQGEYRPTLLFPDHPEISARIVNHPALVWKAQNTATHLRKRKTPRKHP